MSKRKCGVPGCPHLIEAKPDRFYCNQHDALNRDLSGILEDEARSALESFVESALETSRWSGADSFDRYVATEILEHAPHVTSAADAGETWIAVRHALWIGFMYGHDRGMPDRHKVNRLKPLAEYGQARRNDLQSGTANRKGQHRVDPTILRDAVLRHPRAGKPRSWSTVCTEVGHEHALSGRQVRRVLEAHHPGIKW